MFTIPFPFFPPGVGEALSEEAKARRQAQLRAVLIAAAAFVVFLMFKKRRG